MKSLTLAVNTMVITQNNCQHQNLLGNKQLRAVDSTCIKHCEKRLMCEYRYCQTPVFSLGLSQQYATFCLNSIGRRSCEIIMEEKSPLSHEVDFETSKSKSEVSKSNSNISVDNYFLLENYFTSE